jgi:putative transposase
MTQKRTRYKSDFKAKVALEALKEQKTLTELSGDYQLHSNQILDWKKIIKENAFQLFEPGAKADKSKQEQELIDRLYRQIGQLQVELDWLKKKLNH